VEDSEAKPQTNDDWAFAKSLKVSFETD